MQGADNPKTGPERPEIRSPEAASQRTATDASQESKEFLSKKNSPSHSNKGNEPCRVILYDPISYGLETKKLALLQGVPLRICCQLSHYTKCTGGDIEAFEVPMPSWRNTVNIYLNSEKQSGFIAQIHLNRLGKRRNMQRRLRQDFTKLYVKGSNKQ